MKFKIDMKKISLLTGLALVCGMTACAALNTNAPVGRAATFTPTTNPPVSKKIILTNSTVTPATNYVVTNCGSAELNGTYIADPASLGTTTTNAGGGTITLAYVLSTDSNQKLQFWSGNSTWDLVAAHASGNPAFTANGLTNLLDESKWYVGGGIPPMPTIRMVTALVTNTTYTTNSLTWSFNNTNAPIRRTATFTLTTNAPVVGQRITVVTNYVGTNLTVTFKTNSL
jgi:hypothetical protein